MACRYVPTLLCATLLFKVATLPCTADEVDPKAGLRLWINGSCSNCHGRDGQGGAVTADFSNGPSLRNSTLDADSLREIIGCGIAGSDMPGSLIGAYTDTACWDTLTGEVPSDTRIISILNAAEIETLISYIKLEFMKLK